MQDYKYLDLYLSYDLKKQLDLLLAMCITLLVIAKFFCCDVVGENFAGEKIVSMK